MPRRLAAATTGAVLIAAAVLAFALGKHPIVAGTNAAAPLLPAVTIQPDQTRCQAVSRVPGGTTHVRVVVSGISRQPGVLQLRVQGPEQGAGVVGRARAQLAGRVIRLDSPTKPLHPARVCLHYTGPGQIVLSGERKRLRVDRVNGGIRKRGIASLVFLKPGLASWASRRNVIADRYAASQAHPLGKWSLWFAVLAAIGAALLALWWLVFRLEPRREPS
jgi:hypothetical protein